MAQDLAETPETRILAIMAEKANMEPMNYGEVVVRICFPDPQNQPTRAEFAVFLMTANSYGLNPLMKEIYGIKSKAGPIVPVVPIDGWLRMINSQPSMNGITFRDTSTDKGQLISITCSIHRKDRDHPIEVTEYLDECRRTSSYNKPEEPWNKYPHRMLRHKALIQAARYAFGYAGVYDPDEAERIIESPNYQSIEAEVLPPPPDPAAITLQDAAPVEGAGSVPPAPEPAPTPKPKSQRASAKKTAEAVSQASAKGAAQEYLEEDKADAVMADEVASARITDSEKLVDLDTALDELTDSEAVLAYLETWQGMNPIGRDYQPMIEKIAERHLDRVEPAEEDDGGPPPPPPPDENPMDVAEDPGEAGLRRDAYKDGFARGGTELPAVYARLPSSIGAAFMEGADDRASGKPSRYA